MAAFGWVVLHAHDRAYSATSLLPSLIHGISGYGLQLRFLYPIQIHDL